LSREPRTATAQDGADSWSGRSAKEQFLSDPFIGDAPVGLGEAFENPQPVQPTGIDLGGGNGGRSASRAGGGAAGKGDCASSDGLPEPCSAACSRAAPWEARP